MCGAHTWFCFTLCIGRSAQADRRPKAGGALAWLEERKRACMDGSGGCVQGEKHADGSEDTQEYE